MFLSVDIIVVLKFTVKFLIILKEDTWFVCINSNYISPIRKPLTFGTEISTAISHTFICSWNIFPTSHHTEHGCLESPHTASRYPRWCFIAQIFTSKQVKLVKLWRCRICSQWIGFEFVLSYRPYWRTSIWSRTEFCPHSRNCVVFLQDTKIPSLLLYQLGLKQ